MTETTIFITSFLASILAVAAIRKIALHYKIGFLPSARKIHQSFVPVLGGFDIFAGEAHCCPSLKSHFDFCAGCWQRAIESSANFFRKLILIAFI